MFRTKKDAVWSLGVFLVCTSIAAEGLQDHITNGQLRVERADNVGSSYHDDFTCILNEAAYTSNGKLNLIAVGKNIHPVKFKRYQNTGLYQKVMPNGKKTTPTAAVEVQSLERTGNDQYAETKRNGIFSCTEEGNTGVIAVPVIVESSTIRPRDFLTKTVNVGDDVTISVKSDIKDLKWKKDGVLKNTWRKKTSFTITRARTTDAGIYECFYRNRRQPHAIMRLIVRKCPANLTGNDCEVPCVCYNGGVCRNDGNCICPPGFSGDRCGVLSGPDCFGRDCQYNCDDPELAKLGFRPNCEGQLFCLEDPYGCSCAPGFNGIDCKKACPDGSFGADCKQTCHCADGGSCDNRMGICTPPDCQDGWAGGNCNHVSLHCTSEPCQNGAVCVEGDDDYTCTCLPGFTEKDCETACPDGSFGADCKQTCHCADGGSCDNIKGICTPPDCQDGWTGESCNDKITCGHNPCQNDAECLDINEGFECICPDGFTGDLCQVSLHCTSEPCQNGAACVEGDDDYTCTCLPGFKGKDCETVSTCRCSLWAEPHHLTFDGQEITFQGECEYIIAQHTIAQAVDSGLQAFSLIGFYHKQRPMDRISRLTYLKLELKGKDFRMHNQILYIDGELVSSPYLDNGISIILLPGGTFFLATDFGLGLDFKDTVANVRLNGKYSQQVDGLCGNCDGIMENDCNGTSPKEVRACANEWAALDNCSTPVPFDACLENRDKRKQAKEICNEAFGPDGPFSSCEEATDLDKLRRSCEFDLCATLPDETMLCTNLENLATVCRQGGVDVGDWRAEITQCAFDCPAGSTYNHCGSACPQTCIGDNTVECDDLCVEVCECPDGQALSNGMCTPLDECGCTLPNGSYLPSGQSIYQNNCLKFCTCQAGQLSCKASVCHQNAECATRSGVERCFCEPGFKGDGQNCTPLPTCKCSIWGDLHYHSFDGVFYDFQGDCEYTLLKPCDAVDVPDFELIGNNVKNSPTAKVAYLREIRLMFQGKVYELLQHGKIVVNGERVPLPYHDGSGVHIMQSLPATTLYTDFGLTVVWNGNSGATINILKQTFFDNTCGLCGTCNDIRRDDFKTKTGELVSNANDFGNSWKTGDRQCVDPEPDDVCAVGEPAEVKAKSDCNAIIDPNGALAICHDFVDPEPIYDSCVFDVCVAGTVDSLCSNMEQYVDDCSAAGASPNFWWKDRPECIPDCPPDSIYIPNYRGCPPSCAHPRGDPNCPFESIPTCFCPPPAVFQDGECDRDCSGCDLESGAYIKDGSVYVNEDCTESCACVEGDLQCSPLVCSEFAECGLKGGVRGCQCVEGYTGDGLTCEEAACQCTAWGDPHYITFDGRGYDFQGDCEYILVERCSDDDTAEEGPLGNYRVIANNVKDTPTSRVSFTRAVRLEVNDNTYEVMSAGAVLINGIQEPLPYSDDIVTIQKLLPNKVVIDTNFQLSILFEQPYTVKVKVFHEKHEGKTCGLCGTCTMDRTDDFKLPNGELATNAAEFGNAWSTKGRDCIDDEGETVCEEDSEENREAMDTCSILISVTGPFRECHEFVDPAAIFDTCTTDVCVMTEKDVSLCNNLRLYARQCVEAGGSPGNWILSAPACGQACPAGMIYDPCGSACQPTCAGDMSIDCKFICEEVCRCPDDLLLNGDECVTEAECGCRLPSGGYIKQNTEWVSDNCGEVCTCTANGLKCEDHTCLANSNCAVKNGIMKCYCDYQYVLNDGICVRGPAVAHVFGDPHFVTYDNKPFDFQGTGQYILAQKCFPSDLLPEFKLIGQLNKDAPRDVVSYLRYLRLEYEGKVYELYIGGKAKVNDRRIFLPYEDPDNDVIIGNQVFGFATISVGVGLFIMFDNLQRVEIHVHALHKGLVCGLVGTNTGSKEDDFRLPNGQIVENVQEFGAAWRIGGGDEPTYVTDNPCSPGSEEEIQGKNLCNLLIRNPGPFSPCFAFISPQNMYNACVMDVCVSHKPDDSCSVMTIYAQQCRQSGGMPGDWRAATTHCDPPCPEHSILIPIGQGCQRTCQDRTGQENCQPNTVIESCFCSIPRVLHNDQCILPEECGCVSPGNDMMEVGDRYISNNCDEICHCRETGLECGDYSCHEKASCVLKDGLRQCCCGNGYTGDGQTCSGSDLDAHCTGDPHFTSFDKRRFNYQGACEYTLVEVCGEGEKLPLFKLIGNFNKPYPHFRVTVTVSYRLQYKGSVFEIRGSRGSFVDGVPITLPFTRHGVTMTYVPNLKWVISTDFGLVLNSEFVTWQNTQYANVFVRLSPKFTNRVCGLFGFPNGNIGDEYRMPNGQLASGPVQFGNSWQTGDRECQPPQPVDPCPEGHPNRLPARDKCWVIVNEFGPLGGCSEFTNPENEFNDCIYDVCLTNLDTVHVCKNIEAFVDLCRGRGGNPGKWWKYVPECAAPCPAGLEYTDCGNSCPPSCQHPDEVLDCVETCIETCQCPEGQVLDGDKCIFLYNCGCTLQNGVYISQDEVFTYDDCSLRCTCVNGEEQCEAFGCRGDEECKVVGEVRSCFCKDGFKFNGLECSNEPCHCQVWGDPHYVTFDGQRYDFQGDCEYILVKTFEHGDLPEFAVLGRNRKNKPSAPVSFLRQVKLQYNEIEYEIISTGVLKVDGIATKLPFTTGGTDFVTIGYLPPGKIIIITHFGLKLIFTYASGGLTLEVDSIYYESLRGLCGTCNQDGSDEYVLPSGQLADSATAFGNAWATEGDGECTPDPGTNPCDEASDVKKEAEDKCFILEADGPFTSCHEFVDATAFYDACVYDICVTEDRGLFCPALYAYAQACRDAGGHPGQWWKQITECPAPCPADMTYTISGPACPATCARKDNPVTCDINNVETCVCPEGKLLDGERCVLRRECGCDTPEGTYISSGSDYVNKDCSQRCTCTLGELQCETYQCSPQASCQIKSGKRACFCSAGYIGNGQECELADCECFLWTNRHIRTFDQVTSSHSSSCEYKLLTNRVQGEDPFQLSGIFSNTSSSILKLEITDVVYDLRRDRVLVVDGVVMTTSYKDDMVTLLYLPEGSSILTTALGISVYYGQGGVVSIKVPSSLKDNVYGLCGTCNTDANDDLTLPDGSQASDAATFAVGWAIGECDATPDGDPCGGDDSEAKDKCYQLIDPDGVFADCHDFIMPASHYETCIGDFCVDAASLCDNFASYASQCLAAGGQLDKWRQNMPECGTLCPKGTSYSSCGPAVQSSCTDMKPEENTLHNCIETCPCNFGSVLKEGKCVTQSKCDCFVKDYGILEKGVLLVNEKCTITHQCIDNNIETDRDYSCAEKALCGDKNDVYKCHCDEGYEGDGQTCESVTKKDCYELLLKGNTEDGVYTISPDGYPGGEFEVYCDMTTDGGGWTVFQNRQKLDIEFYRGWEEYKNGFGDLNGDFWLGNEAIHYITNQKPNRLAVDITYLFIGETSVQYQLVTVGSEDDNYRLVWNDFVGLAHENGLSGHSSMPFSTFDRDNDNADYNCAETMHGAWWYNACYFSNLNGKEPLDFFWLPSYVAKSRMRLRPADADL